MQCSEHEDKESALRAAFKNASKHGVHLYANVVEQTLRSIKYGWDTTGDWTNTADSGKWSGWLPTPDSDLEAI